MRRKSYFALIFFILLCFSISPSLANPQMNISSWGTINYSATSSSSIKILRQSFQYGSWSASKFAEKTDVYQGHYDALSVVPQIKALRPTDYLAFVYFNTIRLWASGPEYIPERVTEFKNNGWVLKDSGGNYVMNSGQTGYYIDFGHPNYHTWLANWYKHYIDTYGLDGASLDNWFAESNVWYSGVTGTPINPRTGTYWTNTDIKNAFKAMTLKIRQVLGNDKIILVNGVYNGGRFWNYQSLYTDAILNGGVDAVMCEGWICNYDANDWVSEDWWKKSIDFAIWMENNFPSINGKYFMFIHTDKSFVSGNSFPSDMTKAQYQEFVIYGYASRLLTTKNLDTMVALFYYIEQDFPQSLFQIEIGTPTESYHTLENTHIYARKFSGGMVLVNPTYNSYTVTIGSGYKNAVTGSSVSSTLTVQPHTGLILTTV